MNRPDPSLIIAMRGVSKWYGDFQVLKDIDLEIAQGERVVVCGPSGSGKSTMIRCLNRLEAHQEGTIFVDGIELTDDVKNVAAIRREIGMVFQQFNLFPHLTVLQNLTLGPMRARRIPAKEAEERAHTYLERVHIADQAGGSIPASCPADSNSGSPLPAVCAWNRRSCCSTNRHRRWTRK